MNDHGNSCVKLVPIISIEVQSAPEAALVPDTNCKFRRCPKLPSGLIIHWKDSQKSRKAVTLTGKE